MNRNINTVKTDVAKSISVLWNPLTDEQRDFLLDNIEIRIFPKNEPIYKENERPEYIMCLLKGKVKVFIECNNHNQIVRMIGEKGFFGYRAAFADENYMTGASAFEDSTVCMIPIKVIKKLISENTVLSLYFIKELSMMLGAADMQTISLTQKHVRARLAESLLFLKEKYGIEEDGSTLSINPSREDLANMSNMTTSNAIRTLSAFASECLIATDGRKIKIINETKLQNISEKG